MSYIHAGVLLNGTLDALLSDLVYLVYRVYRIERKCNGKLRMMDSGRVGQGRPSFYGKIT